jgi:hypothetical protein
MQASKGLIGVSRHSVHIPMMRLLMKTLCWRRLFVPCIAPFVLSAWVSCSSGGGDGSSSFASSIAPSAYTAYSGTDPKAIPSPPALGPANSLFNDPTFGSRLLRVTDANTAGGASFISDDSGTSRTWNANATAIKLRDGNGISYWLEFDANRFQIGGTPHRLNFDTEWEWSAVDPDILYFLNGNQLAKYNITTGVVTNLGGPPNGDPVTLHVAVVGQDNWVCAAAGAGAQNTYTKLFCINPNYIAQSKFFDFPNWTMNGIAQSDPNWPSSAAGQTIGIHSLYGSAGGAWLGVDFHQQSWGANGDAVLNLESDTWSLVTPATGYAGGHTALGNGRFVVQGGSINGMDGRGAVLRDPNDLINASKFVFIMQPPDTAGFYDSDHESWFNASTNPNAPVLSSRYNSSTPPTPVTWYGEIVAAATDGSNTVWRFAHNHNGGLIGYFACAFAQISNDGHWAIFSSYWDGTLGASNGDFSIGTRIDTFIVELL